MMMTDPFILSVPLSFLQVSKNKNVNEVTMLLTSSAWRHHRHFCLSPKEWEGKIWFCSFSELSL